MRLFYYVIFYWNKHNRHLSDSVIYGGNSYARGNDCSIQLALSHKVNALTVSQIFYLK